MKTKITLLVALMVMIWASPVRADELELLDLNYKIGQCIALVDCNVEPTPDKQGFWASRDPWTKEDTYWQIGSIVLNIIDWGQTRNIAKNPDKYYEKNKLLGEHPSASEVDHYYICVISADIIISYILPKKWRRISQVGTIIYELDFVKNNYELGIGMKF